MNSISKGNISDRFFVYAALLCLFLTTFPLAQGWISLGDFIPRFAFLALFLFIKPQLYQTKDLLFIIFFVLYTLISSGFQNLVSSVANLMEFTLPLILANFFFNKNNYYYTVMMARFAIVVSVIIMINSIIVSSIEPNIIRMMVAFSAEGDTGQSLRYLRMGVCIYSFAMISMCLAPVFLYLASITKHKYKYIICFLINVFFVYITGITTCSLIVIIMVLLYFSSRKTYKAGPLILRFLIIAILIYSFGLVFIESLLPYLENTNYYSRIGGLLDFLGRESMVSDTYDVEGRSDLYKYSIETFITHPLFGSATEKIGGHNYFLDHFARVGIVGMIPFIVFLYYRFKNAVSILNIRSRIVYIICISGFILLGFLKGMNGIDFWTYMLLYIPCILKYGELQQEKVFK